MRISAQLTWTKLKPRDRCPSCIVRQIQTIHRPRRFTGGLPHDWKKPWKLEAWLDHRQVTSLRFSSVSSHELWTIISRCSAIANPPC